MMFFIITFILFFSQLIHICIQCILLITSKLLFIHPILLTTIIIIIIIYFISISIFLLFLLLLINLLTIFLIILILIIIINFLCSNKWCMSTFLYLQLILYMYFVFKNIRLFFCFLNWENEWCEAILTIYNICYYY